MKRKWMGLIAGAAALASLTCGIVLAACNDNPQGGPKDGQVTYTVSVKSVGGATIGDVLISVYDKNNKRVSQGRTDKDGNFITYLEPGEYELDVSGLPAGYTLTENNNLELSATAYETTVSARSGVIMEEVPSDKVYQVGDVMYDFTLMTMQGNIYTLSELLGQKKAVVLNFWATWCGPCGDEFPAINNAYQAYQDDIALIAIDPDAGTDANSLNTNPNALTEAMEGFLKGSAPSFEYLHSPAIGQHFDTSSIPVTVCIDRYGVLAYFDSGSETNESTWRRNFAKWSSDDYVQDFKASSDEGGNTGSSFMKPSEAEEPPTEQGDGLLKRVNGSHYDFGYYGEHATEDAEYSWPWNVKQANEDGQSYYYLYPTNSSKINGDTITTYPSSFATIYSNFETTKERDTLKFEYKTSCEEDYDVLYVMIDDMLMFQYSGVMNDWAICYAYVSLEPGEHRLGLLWLKDSAGDDGDDTVMVRNIDLVSHDDIYGAEGFDDGLDLPRNTSWGEKAGGTYDHYSTVVLGSDGYYHIAEGGFSSIPDDPNGAPYLFADLMNATNFSTSTISQLAVNGAFIYADRDDTAAISEFLMAANNSEIPGLIPVTAKLKDLLDRFCRNYSSNYHENKWLEICKYFDHYGKGKGFTDLDRNPALGLSYETAYDAYETTHDGHSNDDPYLNKVLVNRLVIPRGFKFKFVPQKSGVYQIDTQPDADSNNTIAWVFVRDSENPIDSSDRRREDVEDVGAIRMTCYFDAGQEYYLAFTYDDLYTVGEFTFTVKYLGASANVWTHASDSVYTFDEATTDILNGSKYAVIKYVQPVLHSDGYYYDAVKDAEGNYHKNANGEYVPDLTRPIYIDFAHTTYMFPDDSLEDMLEMSWFMISDEDRATLKTVYLPLMSTGDPDGDSLIPPYGYVRADRTLIEILARTITNGDYGLQATYNWLMLAYFYEHFGA